MQPQILYLYTKLNSDLTDELVNMFVDYSK